MQRLTNTELPERNATWSPDGNFLLYTAGDNNDADVYIVDVRDKTTRRITNNKSREVVFEWSPDGKAITFVSAIDGNLEICAMKVK